MLMGDTRRQRLVRVGAAASTLALVSSGVALSAASAATHRSQQGHARAHKSANNGMPDLSYFKGKTITIIAPDKPGGGYDLYARTIAPGLAQVLHATVNVTNNAGAGTIAGTNQLWSSAPNGLTIGEAAVGGDIASLVEKQPGQNFNLRKFQWLGQIGNSPDVLVVQPNSPYKLFTELLHSKATVAVDDVRNGVGDLLDRVIFGAFNIKHTFITGYTSTGSLKQGFLAGDGTALIENIPTLMPMLESQQGRALLVTAKPAALPRAIPHAVKGVPTLAQELSSAKVHLTKKESAAVTEAVSLASLAYDFAAPPGTPKKIVQTLRTAFLDAIKLPVVKSQALKEIVPLQPIPGQKLNKDIATALGQASIVKPYVTAS
jgi:tripartite-type tricarboxylate transporter receptor subunit TctC